MKTRILYENICEKHHSDIKYSSKKIERSFFQFSELKKKIVTELLTFEKRLRLIK